MITDPKEIKDWLDKMEIENYSIRPDGIVDVNGNVDLHFMIASSLPVQFGIVTGYFYCPVTKLTTLEGMPSVIGEWFSCRQTNIISLSGIHKIIKQINGPCFCGENVTHILGLLLIPGITEIDIDRSGPIDRIMNKYIGTGDIISAQDELIDAGFIEQAKL